MKTRDIVAIHHKSLDLALLTRELMAFHVSPPSDDLMKWKEEEYEHRVNKLLELLNSDK
ncbi:hypothetical protein vBYenSP400_81 [Yersinia phage vB_YenS_P400]|nr:hypothetical protein vBYenSP400_81 [Yersinia phage vB_YenS_P400]